MAVELFLIHVGDTAIARRIIVQVTGDHPDSQQHAPNATGREHANSLAGESYGRTSRGFVSFRRDPICGQPEGGASDTSVVRAAGEGTFLHLLSEPLHAFQRGKRSKLRVLTRDREQALSAVQSGDAHLAVTVIDDIPPKVISRRVAKVGTAVVMPRNHHLARKRSIAIRDLRNEPLIAPPTGRPLRATLVQAWAAADQTWAPAVEANGWDLMMRFAELGLGMAFVNDFCSPPRGTVRRPLSGLPSVHTGLRVIELGELLHRLPPTHQKPIQRWAFSSGSPGRRIRTSIVRAHDAKRGAYRI